jgi:hypothetical protein
MIVRAGMGQWPERAAAARRIESAINWQASRAIPSLAVTLTPAGPCGDFHAGSFVRRPAPISLLAL